MKYLFPLLLISLGACGGGVSTADLPTDPTVALDRFLSAVRANDIEAMGHLWGTERGPAAGRLDDSDLARRLTTMQIYLEHRSYRIVGPAAAIGSPGFRQAFEVELTRMTGCTANLPIELVRTRDQRWIVVDVHLDQVDPPARACGERR